MCAQWSRKGGDHIFGVTIVACLLEGGGGVVTFARRRRERIEENPRTGGVSHCGFDCRIAYRGRVLFAGSIYFDDRQRDDTRHKGGNRDYQV